MMDNGTGTVINCDYKPEDIEDFSKIMINMSACHANGDLPEEYKVIFQGLHQLEHI